MRTKTIKINGKDETFILMAGISGLVKVYLWRDEYWLNIGRSMFTPDEYYKQLISDYVNLRYMPTNRQETIKTEFIKLCNYYK